ncbi:MAG: helix-turn-helix transcriptional regulator [Proteobacteria bacterium]|nr:helix-turn-helix transcriptional regulator [Pseudomonadota bacterium]
MTPFDSLKSAIGLVVATRRAELGWSQQELALRGPINTAYLGRLERGETGMVSLEILDRLGQALGVLPEQLIAEARARVPEVRRGTSVRPGLPRGRRAKNDDDE